MIRLLLLTHLPFWRRLPNQAILPVLGVAIGVGAIVAIDLGSGSTVSSFKSTMERLEGRATHQILPGAEPLRGEIAWSVAELDGVRAAAPVLEAMALAGEPLRIYGIDPLAEAGVRQLGLSELGATNDTRGLFLRFLSEPGALVVSAPYLRRIGLAPGDSLELALGSQRRNAFVLAALPEQVSGLDVPDNLALCDLATAQELTGRSDVTRIDLVLDERIQASALERIHDVIRGTSPDTSRGMRRDASRGAAGEGVSQGPRVERPGGRSARLEGMLRALRTNLEALSYLALFVSLFLIYNAMLLAVLRRRSQIGIVRCLGATRGEVLGAWLLEAGLMGSLGTVLGLGLGLLGGRVALEGIAQTASDLYGYVQADAITLTPRTFVKAVGVGLIATLLTALLPALEAARTAPARTAFRGEVEAQAQRRRRIAPLLAVPLVLVMLVCLAIPSASPLYGYAAALCLALAAGLFTPWLSSVVLAALRPVLSRLTGVVGGMAAENIRQSMSRTGVALAALTVALAMSIAMGTMVGSFRQELTDWIESVVRADIYVSPATAEADRVGSRIAPELVEKLRRFPTVETLDTYRGLAARLEVVADPGTQGEGTQGNGTRRAQGIDTYVAGVDVGVYRSRARPHMVQGPAVVEFLDRIESGEAGVTETLMRKLGLRAGDSFDLEANGRVASLEVAGVYRDYSSDRGVVLLNRTAFERAFGALDPNSVALYVDPGVDVEATVERLKEELAAEHAVLIRSNRSLREQAITVFDRTFSVARALEIIGVGVAAIGILAALLAMLLERRRELATLRAVGLTSRQLSLMLLIEAMLMALVAWVFAIFAGTGLAWILLRVINVRSFGWSLPFHLPWSEWGLNLQVSLLAAILATWIPILRSRRISLAAALREE